MWIIGSKLKILKIIIIWWVNLSLEPLLGTLSTKSDAILNGFQLVLLQCKSSVYSTSKCFKSEYIDYNKFT